MPIDFAPADAPSLAERCHRPRGRRAPQDLPPGKRHASAPVTEATRWVPAGTSATAAE